MKKQVKILTLILCLALCLPFFVSCGAEPLITYEDRSLSVNVYEFLLSRMKGTLAYYGYEVDKPSFWKTVVSLKDGTTYNDYFCATIMQQATYYVIADRLFDEQGLKLSSEDEKKVDDLLAAYVKRAGSKSKLNAELKEFGVNYDILREIYILEAKIELLKEHLYGKNGEKIDVTVKEEYYNENYVAFKQIFLATYDYVTDKDRFGDTVYYTDEKHKAIAYDKENGKTKTDEFGKVIKDVLGDPEYFTEDGKIAYDRKNGFIGYVTNDDGDKVIEDISDTEKGKLFEDAKKYASECDGNIALFEEYMSKYGEGEGDSIVYLYASDGYYAAQNDAVAYFDDIAEKLLTLEVGECDVFKSDYGYHVVSRYENEDGAYDVKDNEDMFSDFYESLISRLFDSLCEEYADEVTVDEKVFDEAPTMVEVGSNTLY